MTLLYANPELGLIASDQLVQQQDHHLISSKLAKFDAQDYWYVGAGLIVHHRKIIEHAFFEDQTTPLSFLIGTDQKIDILIQRFTEDEETKIFHIEADADGCICSTVDRPLILGSFAGEFIMTAKYLHDDINQLSIISDTFRLFGAIYGMDIREGDQTLTIMPGDDSYYLKLRKDQTLDRNKEHDNV